MYQRLGDLVTRWPVPWIAVWVVFGLVAISTSPEFIDVWKDGEFAFLPDDAPSRVAEDLFREAFPSDQGTRFSEESVGTSVQQDPLGSSIVIVLVRDKPSGLTAEDHTFISDVLFPNLVKIQETTPQGYAPLPIDAGQPIPDSERVIKGISTFEDRRIGKLLESENEKATLVVVELTTEFLDRKNALVLGRVEELLNSDDMIEKPLGLAMALSGSATVGRDMLRAEALSASRTETFTKALVIVLLLMIYRAPLLALVPLVTVGAAVELTLALLRHLARWEWIGLFTGLEVYVTVVVYGAGVDYCLFLIARYKEELDSGASYAESMSRSIRRVGAALATSAGTSICGIGMMGFAEFGKFRQAGFAISFGLFVVLCVAMTFTPAFLLLLEKWAFWPDIRREKPTQSAGWMPAPSLWARIRDQRWLERIWEGIAVRLQQRPGAIFLGTIAVMMPFAIVGTVYQNNLSYGLLTDLPQDEPSVLGAQVVEDHFSAGVTGPITALIRFDRNALHQFFRDEDDPDEEQIDLSDTTSSEKLSQTITQALHPIVRDLDIVDIRNQTFPLGTSESALRYLDNLRTFRERVAKRNFAHRTYTSRRGPLAGQVMRIDLISQDDPFARGSIENLVRIEDAVRQSIPAELRESASIHALGPTPGIRDLKNSTDRDRIRIDILVVISVYIVLVALLRQPAVCAFLIVSVVFSYLVTLGLTFAVFYLRDPAKFTGIDWKVPIYLFTILIAMGEDYNILLMARVSEEQRTHGPIGGILSALTRTGSIISSCGIIMAGTFSSLMTGTLLGMVQLGFALACGVLLDTFVIRPVLVPAYLLLLHGGRLGWLGRWLGARPRRIDE